MDGHTDAVSGEIARLRNEGQWAAAELLAIIPDGLLDAADQAPFCQQHDDGLCVLTDEGRPCVGGACALSGRSES